MVVDRQATDAKTPKVVGLIAFLAFVGTIYAANWAIEEFGIVPVGFGLQAAAGVYLAGLAFTLRDIVHRQLGKEWVVAAIGLGSVVSLIVAPRFATASAAAFFTAEAADYLVYGRFRRAGWLPAVVASNIAGLTVNSIVFLWLAFGSLAFLGGQIVGKAWMTAAAVGCLAAIRHSRLRMELA